MNAAFFDMDGTLIDSKADLAATVNATRRELGLAPWSVEDIIAHVGFGAKRLLADTIPEHANDIELLWETFQSHYSENMVGSVRLYPGVRETLEELHERGWLLGVNTAKPAFATHAILERFGIAPLFGDAVIAGGDCAEMKPSALPLVECARRMGHALTSADWMVGDGGTDLRCAVNAGVKGCYCAYGFGRLDDAPFDAKISEFPQFLKVL